MIYIKLISKIFKHVSNDFSLLKKGIAESRRNGEDM
jgi:hypothetical protein